MTVKCLKLSKAGLNIIEVIYENDWHMNADEIYRKLKLKSVGHSLSTIYRNLKMLEEVGALKRIKIANTSYYNLEKVERNMVYIQAKCVKCSKIIEINERKILESLDSTLRKLNKKEKIMFKSTNVVLSGICKECKIKLQIGEC
ncbi:Fur family transcriptional regulator [Clostridium estertheticum]|uniref:Fur family transcriptional regulator n=1 Tax=Clostridium estertheticum TaxID=238834 RepID=UPI001CF53223|nr:transcriptional repressor [Clostridium estertheticum]MCB2361316.1 transcriptional repressor [Clostridium estertheticum]